FSKLATLPARDQPTVTSGAGSVWIDFAVRTGFQVAAAGAAVTGLGAVGAFGPEQIVPGSNLGNFGDIAIGASGQVMVAFQKGGGASDRLYASVDADGLGPGGFGKPT